MPFPLEERRALLGVKGVGPAVVARLEQMGIESLAHLSKANALDIVSNAAATRHAIRQLAVAAGKES